MKANPGNASPAAELDILQDLRKRRFLQSAAGAALGALLPTVPVFAGGALGSPLAAVGRPPVAPASESLAGGLRDALLASLNLIPVTGGFLSYIGALFIPPAGKTAEQLWREYADQAVSDALLRLVKADLEGLSSVARLYRDAVESGDFKALGIQSIVANTNLTAAIPRFRLEREEVALLPLYVVAATMHLAVLRDMALKADELGFKPAFTTKIQTQLTRCIAEYTQYVDKQVESSLAKVKADNPNLNTPATHNQPFAALLAAKAGMQLRVIDIRDTWHAFDAVRYPGRVSVRLDREILYLAGWWDSNSRAPQVIPSYPRPASEVRRLEFWQHLYRKTLYLAGVSLDYADGTRLRSGEIAGKPTTIDMPKGAYIDRVTTYYGSAVQQVDLGMGTQHAWRTIGTHDTQTNPAIVAPADHRLSSMRSAGGAQWTDGKDDCGYVIGFQLVNQIAKPISVALFDRVAPNIAPRLLDWIAGDGR